MIHVEYIKCTSSLLGVCSAYAWQVLLLGAALPASPVECHQNTLLATMMLRCGAVILLVLSAVAPALPKSMLEDLSAECQEKLQQIWDAYENPAYEFADCDVDCVKLCSETLQNAMANTQSKGCPPQDDITRCMSVS
jgi:hypothetical protein